MVKWRDYIRNLGPAAPPTQQGINALGFPLTTDFGTAAFRNVGAGADDVAAGNDERIVNAADLLTGMTTVYPYMVESRRLTDIAFQAFVNARDYAEYPASGPATLHGRTSGSMHGVLGEVYQGNTPGDWSYPCGVVGSAVLDSAGNQAFGFFGRVDLHSNGTGTHELNTFNYVAGPPGNYPPDRSFGITHPMPITLTLGAGGDYPSFLALDICREGSEPQTYYTGIYTRADAITDTGILIDSSSGQGPRTGAYLKNRMAAADSAAIVLQSVGVSPVAGSKLLKALNPGGVTLVSIDPSGNVAMGVDAQTTPTRLNVSGSNLVRGIDNTASMFGVTQNAESALGACVQMGSITGSTPFIAASRFGASDAVASPLIFMTDAAERVRILPSPGNGIGLQTPVPANSYNDDADAAAAGIAKGEWYRNGSVLQMRVV